ncbi:hypothetical protein TNCV_3829461 [Trichonephila clavipes]|nr:hypothetical protein TNCV_3829461 [Trichonephila clavipes]
MVCHLGSLQPRQFVKGRQTKIGDKICVRECLNSSCKRLYFAAVYLSVFWRGLFFETQSAFLIGLKSAEGYLPGVHDSPKRGKFPKTSHIMMYLWGTLPSSRRGKCVTLFGGVRDTPKNSSACKQQQGRYTNYCCNPYGKAAPITPPPLSD